MFMYNQKNGVQLIFSSPVFSNFCQGRGAIYEEDQLTKYHFVMFAGRSVPR